MQQSTQTLNYRMTIVYRSGPAARFDWDYYVTNHLPLAVGTSMRHSDITFCDCDKPLEPAHSPLACICVVHFADHAALEQFCTFFATSHAEAGDIIADEPNYTSITPHFIAASTVVDEQSDGARAVGYRVRILLPGTEPVTQIDVKSIDRAVRAELRSRVQMLHLETDIAIGSIPLTAAPACSLIWTVTFATRAAASTFAASLQQPESAPLWHAARCEAPSRAMITASEIIPFDLAHAAAVRDRRV